MKKVTILFLLCMSLNAFACEEGISGVPHCAMEEANEKAYQNSMAESARSMANSLRGMEIDQDRMY